MPRVVYTPASREDIVGLLLSIRRDNPSIARRVHRAIEETLRFLAAYPHGGRKRDELSANLRSIPIRPYHSYIVFYRPLRDGIEVIRVLHGSRNLRKTFKRKR